jgi:hypothetical protein
MEAFASIGVFLLPAPESTRARVAERGGTVRYCDNGNT